MKSGNIDNRKKNKREKDAMQEGSRIHRKIQRTMGGNYKSEVFLRIEIEEDKYMLIVEGRADGVIEEENGFVIDEIKGTYRNLKFIEEPQKDHLAQALCYAYMYGKREQLDSIGVQITYCNMETEERKRFKQERTMKELDDWFFCLIHEYQKWSDFWCLHEEKRNETIKELGFPFEYRKGQKELAVSVYRAIGLKSNLFIQAPTGIGKTLSTIYPSIKAIGEGKADKLFYLTAKTITRSVAEDSFHLLHERNLYFSTITLTAKEKLCPMDKMECNPIECERARGHFDRVNDAIFDVITSTRQINREILMKYADLYQICPFEFSLDVSFWVDCIICDYNYVFNPDVRLKRYFSENTNQNYLFLIDESHNLVARAREMFSAALTKERFLEMKKVLKESSPKIGKMLERCNKNMLELKRETKDYHVWENVNIFYSNLLNLHHELEIRLEDETLPFQDETLEFYFEVRHFINIYERLDDNFEIYTELLENGSCQLQLFCVNPSVCLKEALDFGVSTVFFSATLLPIQYYKKLLSGRVEDYAVYTNSPFDNSNRLLLIGQDVSSKYTRRTRAEYGKIARYIYELANSHLGNYLVFFPSYQYLYAVERELVDLADGSFYWKIQESGMDEVEREDFLNTFSTVGSQSLVGMCVMGGIFSEGIDLGGNQLEGVIVVGTGLPMVCTQQHILKHHFEQEGEDGFRYAYQYVGMNKVLQAAGRVIRTMTDRGVILLLDHRFLQPSYQELFPQEWDEYGIVTQDTVRGWLERFW